MILKKLRTPLIFTAGTLLSGAALVFGRSAELENGEALNTIISTAGACLIVSALAWIIARIRPLRDPGTEESSAAGSGFGAAFLTS